ncbi:MAG: hypothetical protein Q9207_001462 [Kuettlingeria erythrocarpa]
MRNDYRYTSLGEVWERAKLATADDKTWKARTVAISLSCVVLVLVLLSYALGRLPAANTKGCSDSPLNASAPVIAASPIDPNKIATIIENRPLANLVPLILAFSAVLGPTWPIRILHSPQNTKLFTSSPSITRLIESNQENLAPAKHILMFQTDSILCANSPRRVDDFLEHDFIGAPIKIATGHNYNGGLSIRNREKMLEVLQHFTRPANGQFEDQWFAESLRALPPKPDGSPAANLPSWRSQANSRWSRSGRRSHLGCTRSRDGTLIS